MKGELLTSNVFKKTLNNFHNIFFTLWFFLIVGR